MKKPIILTDAARDRLRDFVASDSGMEVLDAMRRIAPLPLPGEPHNILFAAGVTRGWNEAVDTLERLDSFLRESAESLTPEKTPDKEDSLWQSVR